MQVDPERLEQARQILHAKALEGATEVRIDGFRREPLEEPWLGIEADDWEVRLHERAKKAQTLIPEHDALGLFALAENLDEGKAPDETGLLEVC